MTSHVHVYIVYLVRYITFESDVSALVYSQDKVRLALRYFIFLLLTYIYTNTEQYMVTERSDSVVEPGSSGCRLEAMCCVLEEDTLSSAD